jgi:non-ribosomal peptide synthetase component F
VFQVDGPLQRDALERALTAIADRHEIVRSRFVAVGGEARLTAGTATGDPLSFVDLSTVPPGPAADAALDAVIARWYRQPMDLGSPPLLRAELVRLRPGRHILILAIHHIVADEQSIGVVQRELFDGYRAFADGGDPDLPDLPVQYADYSAWQREQAQDGLEDGLAYWAGRLSGLPTMRLPTDRPRPAVRRFTAGWADVDLDPADLRALQTIAADHGTSLFTVLLAAFDLLMARWTGEAEVVVGTPVAGRPEPELENLIGLFVNSVVLRARCAPGEAFHDLLKRVAQDLAEDLAHDHVPFHRLVERLNPARDRGVHPLFQTAFHIVAVEGGNTGTLGDLTLTDRSDEFLRKAGVTTEYDLVVQVVMADGQPRVQIQFAADLFLPETMVELGEQFARLLGTIAADPAAVPDLPPFTARERPAAPVRGVVPAVRSRGPAPAADADAVLAILRAEIGAPALDLTDDFFAAGGSSLTGARAVQRLRAELGLQVTLIDLFDAETIGDLVDACGAGPLPPPGPSVAGEHDRDVPATFAVARLCRLERTAAESAGAHHDVIGLRLTGEVDLAALRTALRDVAERHEPLRTIYPDRDGAPAGLVLDVTRSVPDFAVERPVAGIEVAMRRSAAAPFDLTREPPWRIRLFDAPDRRILLIVLHRVAADAWSTRPLLDDLTEAYSARVIGRSPGWKPLTVPYPMYLERHPELHDARVAGAAFASETRYWLERLAGVSPDAGPRTDRPRNGRGAHPAEFVIFDVPRPVHAGLNRLAARHRGNLPMVVQTAVAAVLSEAGAGTDVTIMCTVPGRSGRDSDDLVAPLAHSVVLRIDTGGDPSPAELLTQVRRTSLLAFTHDRLPFALLATELTARGTDPAPLSRVAVTMCAAPVLAGDLRMPGLRAELTEAGTGLIGHELAFEFTELTATGPGQLWGVLHFATDLFEPATARRLVDRLQATLADLAAGTTPMSNERC